MDDGTTDVTVAVADDAATSARDDLWGNELTTYQ